MDTTRTLLAASLAFCAAAPATASAQGLAWDLGSAKARFDASQDPPAPPAPGIAGAELKLEPFRLVGATDLEAGRLPRFAVASPADLVWHYALVLPEGELPKKKRPLVTEVSDSFPLKKGALTVKGNHSTRIKGKRAAIRSSLLVACSAKTHWLKKANLLVTRTFSLKRRQLERAEFTYELTVEHEGKRTQHVWKGSIQGARDAPALQVDKKEFHVQVEAAIQNGAGWLEGALGTRVAAFKKAEPGRHALGKTALPCFALLRSGVAPKALDPYFAWMRGLNLEDTYSVSLWIMALEARSVERKKLPPRDLTRSVARFKRGQVPQNDRDLMAKAVKWLVATRKHGEGWWSYFGNLDGGPTGHDGKTEAGRGDRSNSQFAVLALHSALASGVEVPGDVWEEILEEGCKAQEATGPRVDLAGTDWGTASPLAKDPRDEEIRPGATTTRGGPSTKTRMSTDERQRARARGWAYVMNTRATDGTAYGSMTGAGVSSLATAREGLHQSRRLTAKRMAQADESLRDGLAWLLENFDAARNPGRGATHYYYWTYSLEKAMDTAGVERLGDREWWRDLAAELLSRQEDDGSWQKGNVESTSFALLVLNRATLPVQLDIGEVQRVATGEQNASHWDLAVVEGVGQLSVRQLLRALASDPGQASARLELARKALAALPEEQRPRLVPELGALLEHPHRGTKRWARESVRMLTGSTKPAAMATFSERWEVLRRIGEGLDHGAIDEAREILRDPEANTVLKVQAMRILGRLRAVEATPDFVSELQAKSAEAREAAWAHLVSLVGGEHRPFEPAAGAGARADQVAAWHAWWKAEGPALLEVEAVRRAVADLRVPERTGPASAQLKKIGKPALRPLVDALHDPTVRKLAHGLLKTISGQELPAEPDPWLEWLEAQR